MHYRLFESEDFEDLYAIEEVCFQPPHRFSRRYMRYLVHQPGTATWIAEESFCLSGFAIVEWLEETAGEIAYIETLEVAAKNRKQGIGAELLRRVEESSREVGAKIIWLHVDAENASAIRLYEAHGYKQKGREEHYYARSRDALIYLKPLIES